MDIEENSGYLDNLDPEIYMGIETIGSERFKDIKPFYTSRSGSSQLYSAIRYGKRYILKCLKEDFRYNPVYRAALTKEFEIGITLDHPNIRRTIGFEEIDGIGMAIIMEYIDGETLEEMIKKGKIDRQNSRRIAIQIAEALQYIHCKQVIHRDLKPANIMITYSGNVVKLIDFSLSDTDSYTVIKIPAGTRSYMAPEQFLPGAKADTKTDIYSFGLILHDLAILANDRILQKISLSCTKKDPEKRAESIAALGLGDATLSKSHSIGSILSSRFMTYVSIFLIVIFLMVISITVIGWSSSSPEDKMDSKDQLDIEVIDYELWKNSPKTNQAPSSL